MENNLSEYQGYQESLAVAAAKAVEAVVASQPRPFRANLQVGGPDCGWTVYISIDVVPATEVKADGK